MTTEARDREEWLRRAGPHALVRATRTGASSAVLALTVRPGTMTNTITAISLRLFEPGGSEVKCELPVFDSYHRQWSLDLTTGTSLTFGQWNGEVMLQDAAGRTVLVLQRAAPEAFGLGYFHDLVTGAWSLKMGS